MFRLRLSSVRLRRLSWSLLPLVVSSAGAATPVWEGYMISAEGARFALSDRPANAAAWLGLGESFAGYTLEKFEREDERLIIRRGAETIELSLKSGGVVSGKGAMSDVATQPAGATANLLALWNLHRPKAKAAKDSFNSGKLAEAERLAREIVAAIPEASEGGRALHDAHMVLGRVALKEGRLAEAIECLLAAAKDNRGDPGMNSFGPNMSLAKDLLERGERDAVLQYFALCRGFWKQGSHHSLDKWTALIKAGGTPKFGPHLVY